MTDWDDPRLFTLPALRRRGIPAEALNDFCVRMGVTGAQATIDPSAIDACAREVLNKTAPRTMVVMDPIRVVIKNFPLGEEEPNFPLIQKNSTGGYIISIPDFAGSPVENVATVHNVAFDKILYIARDDFQEVKLRQC